MALRIAQIIGGLRVGGAERHLVNLLNATSCEYRAAIFIGEPGAGPSFHEDLDRKIEQVFVPIRRRSLPIGMFRLASVLRSRRINVVHTHMFDSNLYGSVAARLAGVPVVVTSEHGENPWKNSFHRALERCVISPLVDVRLCVSPRILEIRRDIDGVPSSKLRLTVNGTVVPVIEWRVKSNQVPVIGTVGRLVSVKDYPRLVQAVAELTRCGYGLRLCIVGDGPDMGSLRGQIHELGLREITHLPGLVTDVARWYRQFDIYVSSSIREGQPVALLEAMAYGLPVVATDVGASSNTVVHGVGGLIVPAGDTGALVNALRSLLDSPELRTKLGANARMRVVDEYGIQAVARSYLELYSDILARKSEARSRTNA